MNSIAQRTAKQVERNYEAFHQQLPALLLAYRDKYALMKDGEVVGIFDTAMAAYSAGEAHLGLGNFSMQKIVEKPVDLGYFSHALH